MASDGERRSGGWSKKRKKGWGVAFSIEEEGGWAKRVGDEKKRGSEAVKSGGLYKSAKKGGGSLFL